jgi:hypothetical protein
MKIILHCVWLPVELGINRLGINRRGDLGNYDIVFGYLFALEV